mmetsp:Transcript_17835/g.58293  ORF Transcript_17835/g.58293 Transcript_17835/m.58293 type:complete len:250 (-) Transcript_17835:2644-3393(-)
MYPPPSCDGRPAPRHLCSALCRPEPSSLSLSGRQSDGSSGAASRSCPWYLRLVGSPVAREKATVISALGTMSSAAPSTSTTCTLVLPRYVAEQPAAAPSSDGGRGHGGSPNWAQATSARSALRAKRTKRCRSTGRSGRSAGVCSNVRRTDEWAAQCGSSVITPPRTGAPCSCTSQSSAKGASERKSCSLLMTRSTSVALTPLGPATAQMGCMADRASTACGLSCRSGCTSPLMQKASSDGVPGGPKSPP